MDEQAQAEAVLQEALDRYGFTVEGLGERFAEAVLRETLEDFRGLFRGRVAILLSGTTAAEQDLDRVRCPILGVNKSYHLISWPRTFAHLLSGVASAALDAPLLMERWPTMPVFTWKKAVPGASRNSQGLSRIHAPLSDSAVPASSEYAGAGLGKRPAPVCPYTRPTPVAVRIAQSSDWSFDASRGIKWVGAAVAALQLCVFFGFEEIVFIGLDLRRRGRHLKAWEARTDAPLNPYDPTRDYQQQAAALSSCAAALALRSPRVRVLNVSHDSACSVFSIAKFDEVFA